MAAKAQDLVPGTLEMLVLRTLSLGRMHGYGIAQHIERTSADVIRVCSSSRSAFPSPSPERDRFGARRPTGGDRM